MNENVEQRTTAPLVHGRMVYQCECCGRSWYMYLEKGIEEFGENHKPSPFTIACPYCDGWASDVSGIQKISGGGYVQLSGRYMYFANLEDRNCGVPMLHEGGSWASDISGIQKISGIGYVRLPGGYMYFTYLEDRNCGVAMLHKDGIARSEEKALTLDELSSMDRGQFVGQIMNELLEDMRKSTEEYIEAVAEKELLEDVKAKAQDFVEAARIIAEQSTYSLEEVVGAIINALGRYAYSLEEAIEIIMNALCGYEEPEETRRTLNEPDLERIRERKKEREKERMTERENASRFRQYKARERAWTTRKRTGQRRREWRGTWREKNN